MKRFYIILQIVSTILFVWTIALTTFSSNHLIASFMALMSQTFFRFMADNEPHEPRVAISH
jgi:hypothetical protein